MREFCVCVLNHGNGKSAIITENDQVVDVLDCEGLTNTEILRQYSSVVNEMAEANDARILTNLERVKRKYHTSDFPNLKYIYTRMGNMRWFRYMACEWTDKQDQKIGGQANEKETTNE